MFSYSFFGRAVIILLLAVCVLLSESTSTNLVSSLNYTSRHSWKCEACGRSHFDSTRCDRCGVRYCTRKCLRAYWPMHKAECAKKVEAQRIYNRENTTPDDPAFHARTFASELAQQCFVCRKLVTPAAGTGFIAMVCGCMAHHNCYDQGGFHTRLAVVDLDMLDINKDNEIVSCTL